MLMELDKNGLNAAVNGVVLAEEEMRNLGFTDHSKDSWYHCFRVGDGVTLNVTIPKDGSRLRIDVLDEDFGQPYDYQRILKSNPKLEFARRVKAQVEFNLGLLSDAGVITGFTHGMYL